MKLQKLLSSVMLLSAGVFIGTGSFAQSPRKTPHRTNPHGIMARMTKPLSSSNIRLYQPIQAQMLQQKPTATKSRLMAVAYSFYDGVFFIPSDSMRLYWNGTRAGNGDALVQETVSGLFSMLYFSSAFYEPKQEIYMTPDPDSIVTYDWDEGPSVYEIDYKSFMELDASGNVVSITEKTYDGTSWENDERTLFSYDAQGNRIEEIYQEWNGTTWDNDEKDVYTYDANNNLTGYEYFDWNTTASSWDIMDKSTYEYDGQGNFTREVYQYYSITAGALVNGSRYSYTYANGNRTSEIRESWDNLTAQWENNGKEEYDYDSNDQLKTILIWDWDAGSWEEDEKYTLTYDASGKNTSILVQEWYGSGWEYTDRYSYSYAEDNLTELILEEWDNSNSSFEKDMRIVYTYNNYNQCTSLIGEEWDGTEWSSTSGNPKYSFYYEEYDGGNDDGGDDGINTALSQEEFQLYPNPAKDQLTVKMNSRTINHIRIVDLGGKVVFSSKGSLNASEVTLPVGNLANGIYLLQLQSGQQQGTRTFVIQH